MAGISRQIQQLGECERSGLIFHVIALLLFVAAILFIVFLTGKMETLSFGDDYLIENDYINSSVTTLRSV